MKEQLSHPVRSVLTAAGFLVLAGMAVLYGAMGYRTACLVFLALSGLFFWLCRDAFYTVRIDEQGITQGFFGKKKTFEWGEIREAGVTAASIVKRKRRDKRPSRCRIYCSVRNLDNDERLAVCERPGRDAIVMGYTPERLREIMVRWTEPVILFNVSGKELFGGEKNLPDLNVREIRY